MTPDDVPQVKPLSYKRRQYLFYTLLGLFVAILPFLYLYAMGYRFEFSEQNLISTGGIYVAAERTGAEIYIDNELVRETRVFRRAFYAQSLETGTHRVHVQKERHHTWVKELPVYPHIVTEAQAFNMPLIPTLRIVAPYTSGGQQVVMSTSTLPYASTTEDFFATSSNATSTYSTNVEFRDLLGLFATTTATTTMPERVVSRLGAITIATSSATGTPLKSPTTTKESDGVRLFEKDGGIFAHWIGSREDMPYYYCAEPFEPYSSTTQSLPELLIPISERENTANTAELLHPVQTVPEDAECIPTIEINTKGKTLGHFDFFPGSTDFVILELNDGVYVSEIDARAWQNMQPLILGESFTVRVENGAIYVYDGKLIYQVLVE